MFELERILEVIRSIQEHIGMIHQFNGAVGDRLKDDAQALQKSYGQITNQFNIINNALYGLSRRIDTLEILASKKFVEEIEEPHVKFEKIGNA